MGARRIGGRRRPPGTWRVVATLWAGAATWWAPTAIDVAGAQEQAPQEAADEAQQEAAAEQARRARQQEARRRFEQGRRAYDEGDFEGALAHFEAAYAGADVRERVFLTFNLAQTHDKLDHTEQAITHYERYLGLAPDGPGARRAASRLEVLRRRARATDASRGEGGAEAGTPTGTGSVASPGEDARSEGRVNPLGEAPEAPGEQGGGWWPWAVAGGAAVAVGAVVAVVLLSGGEQGGVVAPDASRTGGDVHLTFEALR